MKMTDAVNSIPADTDNTQWPEVLADAVVPYMKEMSNRTCGLQVWRRSGL